jgi:hypothetical protein
MVCTVTKPAVYRPRRPRESPLYRTIERYLPEFERIYARRYARRYGPWRPIIGDMARRLLRCGDPHLGFARVRCPDCRHEMFVLQESAPSFWTRTAILPIIPIQAVASYWNSYQSARKETTPAHAIGISCSSATRMPMPLKYITTTRRG